MLANISDIPGFNFEIFAEDCWHSLETSIYVSKRGRNRKTLLFVYDTLDVPIISSIDDHTVQIRLNEIGSIYCQNDRSWDLTIKYDIRSVRYPEPKARECK